MAQKLFAEYLSHVHTINLTVQLESTAAHGATAHVALDGNELVLTVSGHKCSLTLPNPLVPGSRVNGCLPDSFATTKTSRLKTVPLNPDVNIPDNQFNTPWSAKDCGPNLSIQCRGTRSSQGSCDAVFLSGSRVSDFRDLPSETWAEMMDLWHCHKPDEPNDNENALTTKGYSATSKLVARPGVAFVDTLSFLVSQQDCTNIRVSNETSRSKVLCSSCEAHVGEVDPMTSGVRLFKPFLFLSEQLQEQHAKPSTSEWLSCYLLGLIESSGVRKFECRYATCTIWIFSPKVVCSLSSRGGNTFTAMKILFKQDQSRDRVQNLSGTSLHIDELTLAQPLEEALLKELERANQELPQTAGNFQAWRVAFLDRLPG